MDTMNKQKTQRRRSAPSTTEEQMLDLHNSPVYGVDLSQDTRMLELHSKLVQIEDRIRMLIGVPFSVFKSMSQQVQFAFLETLSPSIRAKVEEALRGELGRKRRLRRVS